MAPRPRPVIDENLCANCGSCVVACRFEVMVAGDTGPQPTGPGGCIACGQCVAVCPTRAISHPLLDGAQAIELGVGSPVPPEDLRALLARRRSVRHYKQRPVPDDLLRELIDAAVLAPSGHNAQNWGFSVITSPERLTEIRGKLVRKLRQLVSLAGNPLGRLLLRLMGSRVAGDALRQLIRSVRRIVEAHEQGEDRLFWDAPALVAVHAPASDPTGGESCHYAVGNLITMAVAHGLGTCLVGFLAVPAQRDRSLRRALDVPDGHALHAVCVVGYPSIRLERSVPRREPQITGI